MTNFLFQDRSNLYLDMVGPLGPKVPFAVGLILKIKGNKGKLSDMRANSTQYSNSSN